MLHNSPASQYSAGGGSLRLVIAYAAADRNHLQQLSVRLARLRNGGTRTSIYAREVGAATSAEALAALERCDLLLALMSPELLATDYCASEELATAIGLHESGSLRIVPVILEPCAWRQSPLGRLRPLPQLGAAVSAAHDPAQAYREIVAGLRTIADQDCLPLDGDRAGTAS